jgi:hypothetical protein
MLECNNVPGAMTIAVYVFIVQPVVTGWLCSFCTCSNDNMTHPCKYIHTSALYT